MPAIKRRHFLQFAGSTLAAMGLSQFDFLRQTEQYGRVLAQSTPRKLALLVGINDYPEPIPNLYGCHTDVDLQCELLVHRFGFDPKHILILRDSESGPSHKPSRANILRAFEEHLIKQAKPGDVVVFHYSGHGCLVKDPNPLNTSECRTANNCEWTGAILPNDLMMIDETMFEVPIPGLMGSTLFLLMQAINTENLTVVLDSCFSGAGTRGNTLVRAVDSRLTRANQVWVPSLEELEYQQQWLSRLQLSLDEFQQRRQAGIAKGVAIGSASRNQEALDNVFDGFHAGAFTYLLTRYLWQLPANQSVTTVQANLIRSTKALADTAGRTQVPVFEVQPNSGNEQKPFYFLDLPTPAAEAVITTAEPLEFWLGGVSAQNLKGSEEGVTYSLLDRTGSPIGEAIQKSRNALFGYGELSEGTVRVEPGMLLREKVVGIPDNPILKLGLDPSLGEQIAEAQTALQSLPRIEVLPVDQRSVLDCLLGRMTEDYQQRLTDAGETEIPPLGSVGLFTPILIPIPNSFGRISESVTAAVNRLQPRLKLLLVGQVLQSLTTTPSDLQITGEVFTANRQEPKLLITTRAAREAQSTIQTLAVASEPFRAGDTILIRLENQEQSPLYLSSLVIDAQGNLIVLHPANWDSPEESARIEAEGALEIPRATDEVEFTVRGSGFFELLTLVSTSPLRNSLRGLQTIARNMGRSRGAISVDSDPIALLDQILGDLGTLSRSGNPATVEVQSTRSTRSTETLAAFSTIIEVVE